MTFLDPPMRPAKVFERDAHRDAAAAIVATVNVAFDRHATPHDAAAIAGLYTDADHFGPLDVVAGASVIVAKLLSDEHTVWHVDPRVTIARMGQWVAADEVAT